MPTGPSRTTSGRHAAPAKYKDLVPQMKTRNGKRKWVVAGDIPISGDSAASAILPDGEKIVGLDFLKLDVDKVHAASSQMEPRLEMLDTLGIQAQILYPNVAGFGNQNFMKVEDFALRHACVEIYNDAMAELQAASGDRLLPMILVPWWDIAGVRRGDRALRGPRHEGRRHVLEPARLGHAGVQPAGLGAVLGGLRVLEPADQLPHRLLRGRHGLVRQGALQLLARRGEDHDRWVVACSWATPAGWRTCSSPTSPTTIRT